MPNTLWIYFLSQEELVDTYKRAGGKRGNHDKDCPNDVTIAAHALFLYLMPANLQVWFSALDEEYGMAFIIGNMNATFGQAIHRKLAERCHKVFGCAPDQWTECEGTDPVLYSLERDGKIHTLDLMLFRESDRVPRDYPPALGA
ncbi:unnamed protein product [Rhizoctonia solani]|uniref:Uncharacterized protein n=1 Tax=Rhizoctonia solani TaxID=456999 RepID=A0A8H3ANT9_9AGAM|nr:unnamed protein product [Rhizoctonia solani]